MSQSTPGWRNNLTPPRPVVGILQVDNYEDLNRGLEEGERSVIRTEINNRLAAWVDPAHGDALPV